MFLHGEGRADRRGVIFGASARINQLSNRFLDECREHPSVSHIYCLDCPAFRRGWFTPTAYLAIDSPAGFAGFQHDVMLMWQAHKGVALRIGTPAWEPDQVVEKWEHGPKTAPEMREPIHWLRHTKWSVVAAAEILYLMGARMLCLCGVELGGEYLSAPYSPAPKVFARGNEELGAWSALLSDCPGLVLEAHETSLLCKHNLALPTLRMEE